MFKPKVKIDSALYDKVKAAAEALGSASVEEFIERTLENEADRVINSFKTRKGDVSDKEVEDIANKLKGLGYLE